MENDLLNLLPSERQLALIREQRLRLGVTTLLIVVALTVSAGVLLLPTYIFLERNIAIKTQELDNVEKSLSLVDESSVSAKLTALSTEAALLIELGNLPVASNAIRASLDVARPGITLTNFSYTLPEKTPGVLLLSGFATTRDTLRTYQSALQEAAFSLTADLPVSSYAKDTNIPFTITVTLTP